MGGTAWRRVAAAVALLTLAAACTRARSDDGPTATLGTAPATTTTTDPYALPPVIDAAYVNRVLAGLDQAVGDVVRTIVAARTIPRDVADRLRVFYITTDSWQLTIDGFQEDLREGFAGLKNNPGNQRTTVTEVITASPECVFAKVFRDYSAVADAPDPALSTLWVILKRLKPSDDASRSNSTGWGYVYEGFRRDLTTPKNLCVAS